MKDKLSVKIMSCLTDKKDKKKSKRHKQVCHKKKT